MYRIGDKFKLSRDALDNYGAQYKGRSFTVSGVFTHYCKPENCQRDPTGHPGFDPAGGSPLYETDDLQFALYAWEMLPA
jgi:hypothetical protein